MNYALHLLVLITIYLVLAYGLNLVVGFGGLLSLCYAAFYGLGAYACTLLMVKADLPFLVALPGAVVLTGAFAALAALPALRFRGDTFVVVTLGLQAIVFTVLQNWVGLTRGPYGIAGIPRPTIAGFAVSGVPAYLALSGSCLVIVAAVLFTVYASPFGLVLKALRDDEIAAQGFGKSPLRFLFFAFVLSGMVAAVAGSLYAVYVTYIDPSSFSLDESIFLLAILMVGGSGNRVGPLAGTVFMVLLPEALRFVGLPDPVAPNVRQMIYGTALVLLMFVRPQGMVGEFRMK